MAETLSPNDDTLERAQARAARAAATRRRSLATITSPPPNSGDNRCLGKEQILELFHNCIKLARENKINQKNTWELNLIDHLRDIIKVEEEDDAGTNFQKASCTLEAGVKIYSLRVDCVHSEAYKILGGINRVGQKDEQETVVDSSNKIEQGEEDSKDVKKVLIFMRHAYSCSIMILSDSSLQMSPFATLEPSFETLNVKKFDATFAVDPLYHQTSAQFDEGGAKGLLLNNLGVYGGCRVLFDSSEIPEMCISSSTQPDVDDLIDLTFAKDYVEQMVLDVRKKDEISPTLRTIVNQFDDDNRRPEVHQFSGLNQKNQRPTGQADPMGYDHDHSGWDANDDCGAWNIEHDDRTSTAAKETSGADGSFPENHEGNGHLTLHEPDTDYNIEKVDVCLFLSLGFMSKQNTWAGPDHWKYRKAKAPKMEVHGNENGSPIKRRKARTKEKPEADIDFTAALNDDFSDIFLAPKNPKSLLLPANRAACNTKLPEDRHYQPENLVKLFLLPDVVCFGKRQRRSSALGTEKNVDLGELSSAEDDNAFNGAFGDGNYVNSDGEESSTLVSPSRQVNKIKVQYDRTSKQVDVQALKEVLWERVKLTPPVPSQNGEEAVVSFKVLLASFPSNSTAASTLDHISPHLCFICLLHLANEHGLSLQGCGTLDDLSVHP
ncbi:Condensin complex subunit 2-like protein [Drosera capensis]